MNLAWGKVSNAVGDSALNLSVNSLKLEDWKPFLGSLAQTGTVNAKLKLLSQQAGKLLTFDLNSQIENLTAGSGSNQITQAGVTLQAGGKAVDLKQFNLTNYKVTVARQNEPMITLSGSGTYDATVKNADLQLTLLDKVGVPVEQFGNSTGPLTLLTDA